MFVAPTRSDLKGPYIHGPCQTMFRAESGTRFNAPGRPPVHQWMLHRGDYVGDNQERLSLLGNAVVPLQAYFAARLLSS